MKHVLVTGGSGALGLAVVRCFLEKSYKVCAVTHSKFPQEIRRQFPETPRSNLSILQADLCQRESAKEVVETLLAEWGRVDIVVNCLGVVADGLILSMDERQWDQVFETNTSSVFHLLKQLVPQMVRAKEGHVINVSSISSLTGRQGQVNYVAAKAALNALTLSLAREWGKSNVRFNVVLPGFIEQGMGQSCSPEQVEAIREQTCLGRFSSVDEVAQFIAFVADTKNVSGQIFNVDSRIIGM